MWRAVPQLPLSSAGGVEVLLSPACGSATKLVQVRGRRRILNKPPWVPATHEKIFKVIPKEDRKEMEQRLVGELPRARAPYAPSVIVPKPVPPLEGRVWTPESKRVGLIGRKIGMLPQWCVDGTRVLCTLIEVRENHVVSAVDPDTWFRTSVVGKRKAFNKYCPMWKVTVGAFNTTPTFLTDSYLSVFQRAGVPPKEYLGGFMVTEDAALAPGTPLDVRHFEVGKHVTISAKSIDWGFQGAMHRWGMRGLDANNTTKSHRRMGSTGSKGDARVWPGRRMPGHMGYEWTLASGLEVMRISPQKQVIYVKGSCPGDNGEMVLIKDCMNEKTEKKVVDPPFPTYLPTIDESAEDPSAASLAAGSESPIANDIYHPKLFRFNSPSVVFTEEHETKSATRDRSRAKLAKVKK